MPSRVRRRRGGSGSGSYQRLIIPNDVVRPSGSGSTGKLIRLSVSDDAEVAGKRVGDMFVAGSVFGYIHAVWRGRVGAMTSARCAPRTSRRSYRGGDSGDDHKRRQGRRKETTNPATPPHFVLKGVDLSSMPDLPSGADFRREIARTLFKFSIILGK